MTQTDPKAALALVAPGANTFPPPRPLGPHGMALWNRIQSEYGVRDAAGVEILMQACVASDRAETLAEQIAADGAVIQTRNGPRSHPAMGAELSARNFLCRTLQRLGVNLEPVSTVGRPGSPQGWRGRGD
jgi:hypothetical protein